jgi:hypothetical protein
MRLIVHEMTVLYRRLSGLCRCSTFPFDCDEPPIIAIVDVGSRDCHGASRTIPNDNSAEINIGVAFRGILVAVVNRQRSFSSFRHGARSWPRQRRICFKAEHSAAGTNLRFVITNCTGRAAQVFAFYNDRGECENRIEEFKNGFRADRLSCHRFLANAFRLLLYAAAYNLVNLFRLQLPQPWRSAQIETLRAQLFKIGARVRQTARCVRFHLASGWPFQNLFRSVAFAVNSS